MMRWPTAVLVGVLALPVATARADTIIHGTTTITMDFVPIGHPGNDPDDEIMLTDGTTGYGRVDYVYRIGKYEVNENQWDAVVAANVGDLLDDPGYWSGSQPVAAISWHEAAMFCNWLTSGDVTQGAYTISGSGEVTAIDRASAVDSYGTVYVIPTEDEWYKASYYDASRPCYWDYPTKHDNPDTPDGIDYFGDTALDAVFQDGHNQGHPYDVHDAGVASAYGTIGQGGNISELNETYINSSVGLRGGDWFTTSHALQASIRIGGVSPAEEHERTGFRVASIPEPSALALVGMGALGLLAFAGRRRR